MSIFRYPGGKTKKSIRERILAKAPSFDSYREPFCGGGGIFFSIPHDKERWINDIDVDLMSVYLALRDRPKEFISLCRNIEPEKKDEVLASARNGKALYNARLKEVFNKLIADPSADAALRYFFVNRTNWAGRVNYTLPSRLYFSNASGWNIVKTNKLEMAAECMCGVKITSIDYSELFLAPGNNVWIYADPPYYVNSKLHKMSQLYRHNFDKKDHELLSQIIRKSPHKILLSYDDDDEGYIRSLYSGFTIFETSWTYCGTSSAENQSKTKKKGKELLIANY